MVVHGIRIGRGYPERDTPTEFAGGIQVDQRGTDRNGTGRVEKTIAPGGFCGKGFNPIFST
jgi:hypothetical protein